MQMLSELHERHILWQLLMYIVIADVLPRYSLISGQAIRPNPVILPVMSDTPPVVDLDNFVAIILVVFGL
jgi:hypothetical protein